MRTANILRWAALAALVGLVLPAPASAQIGGFLKRKLKEKIVQTAVSQAAAAAAPTDSAAVVPADGSLPDPAGSAPVAKKRTRSEALRATLFSESTLEVTPEVLDRFEKGLAAEAAERKAIAAQLARLLPGAKYELCLQARVWNLPEYRKAYADYTATLRTGRTELMKEGRDRFDAAVEPLAEPRCGLSPEKGGELRRSLSERPAQAGQQAAGFTESQYAILKERIVPFCTLSQTPETASEILTLPAGYVYTQGEVTAMQPRCARLAAALKGA